MTVKFLDNQALAMLKLLEHRGKNYNFAEEKKSIAMKISLIAILTLTAVSAHAQDSWTMQQCMQYAVDHNHEVKRTELELDNYKVNKAGAIGRFLPVVDAGIGAQYNFG